ncbi:MAG: hypothetical protein J5506_10310 [Prevotella sp.]|nr:hypothetical protein [Prevotella sp.]
MKDLNIDDYLEKPCWVIDILPKQVPANSPGQYFRVEKFFLCQPQADAICRKFINLLVKLNCYYDLEVCRLNNQTTTNPAPEDLAEWMLERKLIYVLLAPCPPVEGESEERAMIGFQGDDHYMTLYNPNAELLELVRLLAASEGLFVWKPINNNKQ